jgi:hypothetical protein
MQQTGESRQRRGGGPLGGDQGKDGHAWHQQEKKKDVGVHEVLGRRVEIRNTKMIASKLSRRNGQGKWHSRRSR